MSHVRMMGIGNGTIPIAKVLDRVRRTGPWTGLWNQSFYAWEFPFGALHLRIGKVHRAAQCAVMAALTFL